MPITVCNSIHVLSEFFDSYGRYNDKKKTLQHVIKELFMPMLYATTTTIAGFASLATTPIPPVRIFGLHVAFGPQRAAQGDSRVLHQVVPPDLGVAFGLDRQVQRAVAGELGLPLIGYGRRVLQDEREQQRVLEAVVNTETYFFREAYQMDLLQEDLLPRLLADRKERGPVVVWSTACSTGEEAYSVAIVALEVGLQESKRLRIIGTDLLQRNIEHARKAHYASRAFRATSQHRKRAFFVNRKDTFEVAPVVRNMCSFRRQNLLNMQTESAGVQADVVLCRNALIYMTPAARAEILCHIYARLRPGGYLLLGHAEMLVDCKQPFETVRDSQLVYYRKPTKRWTEHGKPSPCGEAS